MENQIEHNENHPNVSLEEGGFDYSYVHTIARIARYDDKLAAPRVIEIQPAPTADFIETLASSIDREARMLGGTIPYAVIREVSENFIHARFEEIVVSILDDGNTIRFADQGPGITDKTKAQLPGFTSAIEPMKRYIRGVGSGLPLTKEYLDMKNGTISIEDNLGTGAVVTVSLKQHSRSAFNQQMVGNRNHSSIPIPPLNERQRDILKCFESEGALGVTDVVNLTGYPTSSTYKELQRLEEAGLLEKTMGKKRILTDMGFQVASSL
ncbi:ATP-binding protein [Adlercreutzia sp. ZJ141]|uniref:ATP-binding protein n=1 Tax=Adlercreutzia sp. ZJ141 TaxID=2709406 RepID=UPI0013EDED26|nr:ATP-binding protein [Adlercreutzia sp. ZJ141]